MLKRIARQTLMECGLEADASGILVAVSGGVDSIVLLHVLRSLATETGWRLVVGHVNHRLRGAESDADARFVEGVARGWGLPFCLAKLDEETWKGSGNRQETARLWRYRYFDTWADEYDLDWIATAHHADDQAETMLERLLRGSGLEGLSGIPVMRGRIVRPLLHVSREDIERHARQHALAWREDPSNVSLSYRRNRIRQNVLPVLNEINPGATRHIAAAARRLVQAQEALSEIARELIDSAIRAEEHGISLQVDISGIVSKHVGLRIVVWRELVRRLLDAPPRRFSHTHWELFDRMAAAPSRMPPQELPLGLVLSGGKDSITLGFEAPLELPEVDQELALDGITETPLGVFESFRLHPAQMPETIEPDQAYFDMARLSGGLRVGSVSPGLRIRLPQLGQKRVAKLLSEAEIPRHLRVSQPVVWSQDDVLWIPGIRRSSHALIGPETREILGIKYRGSRSN